ncbi:WD40-repeat-containing domain protein [Phakopsora pachyrhizi]|uniref:WD40-repeat-containing domain protein n=1 Tax=Phakopsora pachyrhizi TaxID=170000 RepID=A0AAV0AXW0_PHAPC|nr:WD40-repeat-containing domain protein [Phakopsora pachyrhizi]
MSFFNSTSTTSNVFGNNTTSPSSTSTSTEPKDIEVENPPTDGISSIAWSPQADFLAAGSWSNEIRIYEVNAQGQSVPKAAYSHEQPVLEVIWSGDGTKIISGGCDRAARAFDVSTGQATQVAAHEAPIRKLAWLDINGQCLLATGSWDKTLKYWDLRQSTPALSVTLPERIYTMDTVFPLMVVGTAARKIHIYHLSNPSVEYKSLDSPLKWQTRCIACFNDAQGYAVGSIEGRVAIQHVEDKQTANNFSFKCHRKDSPTAGTRLTSTSSSPQVWAVNDIKFHKQHGTFATAGSDGVCFVFAIKSKKKFIAFDNRGGPITSVSFNRTGAVFAYTVSYDWSQGHSGAHNPTTAGTTGAGATNPSTQPNKIMLHALKDDEIKKRPKARGR